MIDTKTAAKNLDDVVIVTRHDERFGYQPVVNLGRVTSVVEKPQLMYDIGAGGSPGATVFLPDGDLLGLVIMPGAGQDGGAGTMQTMQWNAMVLPAAEIARLVDHAKKAAAKPAEDEESE